MKQKYRVHMKQENYPALPEVANERVEILALVKRPGHPQNGGSFTTFVKCSNNNTLIRGVELKLIYQFKI